MSDINYEVIKDIIPPTTETVGALWQTYVDISTGITYQCTKIDDGVYTWVKKKNQAIKLEDANIIKAYIDKRITENSSNSGIRTLDTAPTETTEGYAGEIVQVSDGTSYQCTAVADGVYTWVKIIKANNYANAGWTKNDAGVIAFYTSTLRVGIFPWEESGMVFPSIMPANNETISSRSSDMRAPLVPMHINKIVKLALTGDKKIGQGTVGTDAWAVESLTDTEKQEACEVLGATKWYKHEISVRVRNDNIPELPCESKLTIISMRATEYAPYDLEFTNGEHIVFGSNSSYFTDNFEVLHYVTDYSYGHPTTAWSSENPVILLSNDYDVYKYSIYDCYGSGNNDAILTDTFIDNVTEL